MKNTMFIVAILLMLVAGQSFGAETSIIGGGSSLPVCSTNGHVLTWNGTSSEWECAEPPGASGGEANTITNLGTGSGWYASKVGVDLKLKSFLASTGLAITSNANDLTLALDYANIRAATDAQSGLMTTALYNTLAAAAPATSLTAGTINASFRTLAVTPNSDAITAAFRRNGAGQTANLVEFQTEANALLTAIDKSGNFSGNAATATALASNPTDCSAGQYATTIAANGNLTCAQVTFAQLGSTPTTLTGYGITFPDGSAVDLSGITPTGGADEGLAVPNWANVVPASDKNWITIDRSANALKYYNGGWVTVAPTGAPTDAGYLTTTANATLSNESNLGALTTGLLKITVNAGTATPSTAAAGTDYLAPTAINDTAIAAGWNADTTHAPTKNVIYDWAVTFDTDLDGKVNVLDLTAGLVKTDANGVVSVASAGTDYVVPAGNVATATALATNPADCAAGSMATAIAANGDLTCGASWASPSAIGSGTPAAVTATTLSAGGGGFSVDADGDTTVKTLTIGKTSGTPSSILLYEANSTDTNGTGWMGPASVSANTYYQFADTAPAQAAGIMTWAVKSGDTSAQSWIYLDDTAGNGDTGKLWSADKVFDQLALKATLSGATYTGTHTFAGATLRLPNSASLPGTCTIGDIYFDSDATAGVNIYGCTATNTWTLQGDGTGAGATVSDVAYDSSWNGVTTTAPSKNAVYDKVEAMISDTAYAASWDTVTTVAPSKNAVYDQMELRAPKADPVFTGSVQLPNGANPTTDAAGEIAIDTSATSGSMIRFYGDAAYALPAYQTKCTVIKGATTADDYPIEKFPYAITIRAIKVYAIGGTNVVGGLDECTGTNGVCSSVTAVDSDITGTAGSEVSDDGTLTNAGIAAGNWIQWHTTSVSGTNTSLSVCFYYTVDPVN